MRRIREVHQPARRRRTVGAAGRVLLALVVIAAGAQFAPATTEDSPGPATETIEPQPLRAETAHSASAPAPDALPDRAGVDLDELTGEIPAPENPPDARELPERAAPIVAQAEELIRDSDFAAAVDRLERAVAFAPDNARIRRALGIAYAGLPNLGKARRNLQRAVEIAPDDLQAQYILGGLAAAENDNERAIRAFRTALKCTGAEPSNPLAAETLARLGKVLGEEGYWTAALQCYRRLDEWVAEHPREYVQREALKSLVLNPETLLAERGALLVRLRRYEEAIDLLSRAHRRNRSAVGPARMLVEALIRAGRYDRAESLIVEMSDEPAQRAQLGPLAAALCRAADDPQMAIRIWERSAGDRPGEKVALAVALAEAAMTLESPDQALELLRAARRAKPDDSSVARRLARLQIELGRYEQTVRLLAELAAADEPPAALIDDAVRRLAGADVPDEFERELSGRVDDETGNAHAMHYAIGRVASARGRGALAGEHYRRAIELDEQFVPAYVALTDLYITERRFDRLERLIGNVAALDEATYGHVAYFLRGKVALARGDVADAIDVLQLARAQRNDYVPALVLLARAYVLAGRGHEAIGALQAAYNADPDRVAVYRSLFDIYLSTRQYDRAEEVAAKLLDRDAESLAARVMQAELALARDEKTRAVRLLGELSERAAEDPAVKLLSVTVTLQTADEPLDDEQFAEAVRLLASVIRDDPDNTRAIRMLAGVLSGEKRRERAPAIWRQLYQDTNRHPMIARVYANALLRADQDRTAAVVLEEVVAANPDDDQTRYLLLELYRRTDQYDSAQKLLDEWIRRTDEPATQAALQNEKIRLYGQAGDVEAALTYGGRLLDEAADPMSARTAIVAALRTADQAERALEIVDTWLDDTPAADRPEQRSSLLAMRASLLDRLDRPDAALQALQDAHRLTPDDAGACNNLGYSYADRGIRLDEAERLIRKALVTVPRSIAVRDSLGWVFYKQGRFAAAERIFSKLLEDMDEQAVEPVILDHAGDVYWRLGETDRAKARWAQAVEIARRREHPAPDTRELLARTPAKLQAIEAGREPEVAPLGAEADTATQPATDDDAGTPN